MSILHAKNCFKRCNLIDFVKIRAALPITSCLPSVPVVHFFKLFFEIADFALDLVDRPRGPKSFV